MASVRSHQAFSRSADHDDDDGGARGLDSTARLRGPGRTGGAATPSPTPARRSSRDSFGLYRLGRRLGKGGMAEVFAATRVGAAGFERAVCLKRILPHLSADPEFRELFVREARVAGTLCHSNIVQVFDCIEDGENLAIVMELVEGVDLKRLCRSLLGRSQRVPPRAVAHVAGQLLGGLRYAHERRVVHRDISPHNVLVSCEGEVKLADFGVAKAMMTRASRTGTLKGKLAYMSPEQASARPVDHRSDLYSAGLVLFELLVGRRFFPPVGHSELLGLVSNARPPRLVGVEPELSALVGGLLEPRPEDRFQSARDALAALPSWDAVGPAGAAALAELVRSIDRAPCDESLPSPWSCSSRGAAPLEREAAAQADPTERLALGARPDDPAVARDADARLAIALAPTMDADVPYPATIKLGPDTFEDFFTAPTVVGRRARAARRAAGAVLCAISSCVSASIDLLATRLTPRSIVIAAVSILLVGVTIGAGGKLLWHTLAAPGAAAEAAAAAEPARQPAGPGASDGAAREPAGAPDRSIASRLWRLVAASTEAGWAAPDGSP
jgi:serine/threonine-protein kinase